MSELRKFDSNIFYLDKISLTKLLLDVDSKYERKLNEKILLAFITFYNFMICVNLAISLTFSFCIFYTAAYFFNCLIAYT